MSLTASVFTSLILLLSQPMPRQTIAFGLGGQSNGSGHGLLAELAMLAALQHPERLYLFDNAWRYRPATEPIDDAAGQIDVISSDANYPTGVGPGMFIADRIASALNVNVIIIPCALSASHLLAWMPKSVNGGILDPALPLPTNARATLYGSCEARMAEVSRFATIAGFFWYQGESEAPYASLAPTFASQTQYLFDRVRFDMHDPQLPIIYVQLPTAHPAGYAAWDGIRAAQASLQSPTQIMVTAPNSFMPDGLHINTAGQQQLGWAMGDAFVNRLSKTAACGAQ